MIGKREKTKLFTLYSISIILFPDAGSAFPMDFNKKSTRTPWSLRRLITKCTSCMKDCVSVSLSLREWVTLSRTLTLGQIPIVFSIFTEIHRVYYLAASNAQNSHEMRKYCAAQLNAMAKEMLPFVHCFHFAYVPLDFFLVFGTTSLIFTPIPTRNFQDKKKFHLG